VIRGVPWKLTPGARPGRRLEHREHAPVWGWILCSTMRESMASESMQMGRSMGERPHAGVVCPSRMRTYVRALDEPDAHDEEQRRLPGYRDEAVVRRFDAPEALDIRFYEVRAPIGAEPGAGALPDALPLDRQSYRGCTHACVYCFARPTHRYLDFDAGRDFEREIVVKVNAPEVLRGGAGSCRLDARARRARDQHGPLPVGRGSLPA